MKYIIFLLLSFYLISLVTSKEDPQECEVCIKVMEKIESEISVWESENKGKDMSSDEIIELIKRTCKKYFPDQGSTRKQHSVCYHIGGVPTSATNVLKQIARPLGYKKPANKICHDLKKQISDICSGRFEKEIDWANVNLKKMRVKELKNILAKWDDTCQGCLEKSDYIKRIEELKPKFVREEL